jgi:hypothetical protein
MSKQTAVEFLAKSLKDFPHIKHSQSFKDLVEQAKAMEKEQIINTWSEATAPDHEIGLSDAFYIINQIQKAEQYYNEIYGGEK